MQCNSFNPDGQRCALVEGHAGVHQIAASTQWGPPVAASSTPAERTSRSGRGIRWWLKAVGIVVVALLVVGAISTASKPALSDPTGHPPAAPTSTALNGSIDAAPNPSVSLGPVGAAFKDIALTGEGNKVVKFEIPEETAAIAVLTHKGKSNFIVHAVSADGETLGLVNEIGNYSGTVLFDADAGQHSVAFEINADGAWTITIKPVMAAPSWDLSSTLKGTGDGVYIVTPASSGLVTLDLTFKGDSNFIVHSYGSDGREGLANEIGDFSGQVLLPNGTFLLEVVANGGTWSVTQG